MNVATPPAAPSPHPVAWYRRPLARWAAVLVPGIIVVAIPVPAGIAPQSWRLLAIFVSTVCGLIFHPLPGGAIVLCGVLALPLARVMPVNQALAGYADPVIWLVLAAFFIARGMIKTGLGRRIALLLTKAIGRHSLGLGYALVSTDAILATVVPSNAARSGG